MKTYADTFAQWVAGVEPRAPIARSSTSTAKHDSARRPDHREARERVASASAVLSASQARTEAVIIWVGFAAVLIGLGFSWLIGRSITRPLNGLAEAMTRLAAGDTSARASRPRRRRTSSAPWRAP